MNLHFLYHRSTEILTLIVTLSVVGYFVSSLSGARKILNHEQAAYEIMESIYLEETRTEKSGQEIYLPLSAILKKSPLMERLVPISTPEESEDELYSDGNYYYFFRLIEPPKGVDDYMPGQEKRAPLGFEAFAWPQKFSNTGELVYFIDARGRLGVSTNERAYYNGFSSYPPDLEPPRAALAAAPKDPESATWRIKRIPRKNRRE